MLLTYSLFLLESVCQYELLPSELLSLCQPPCFLSYALFFHSFLHLSTLCCCSACSAFNVQFSRSSFCHLCFCPVSSPEDADVGSFVSPTLCSRVRHPNNRSPCHLLLHVPGKMRSDDHVWISTCANNIFTSAFTWMNKIITYTNKKKFHKIICLNNKMCKQDNNVCLSFFHFLAWWLLLCCDFP